jgi:hypothetical protein
MSPSLDLHIHLPAGLTGTVHVHLVTDGKTPSATGAFTMDAVSSDSDGDGDLADMLDRFEAFDPASAARAIYQALIPEGWQPYTPKARGGKGKSDAAYIRFAHLGEIGAAKLYLNSVAAYVQGRGERAFCARLPGAEVQPNGDVYFYFSGGKTDQVLEAASKLRAWTENATDVV